MKNRLVVFFCITLIACETDRSIKIGTYQYVRYNKIQWIWLYYFHGIKSYNVGSELILEKDSLFIYTTCGNIIKGKWNTHKDSLFLNIKSNRWRSDSLNLHGFNGTWPKISTKPIGYKICNNSLERISYRQNNKKYIETLRLIVP